MPHPNVEWHSHRHTRMSPSSLAKSLRPNHQDIVRERAYYKWVNAGKPLGRDTEFWFAAEKEVLSATS